MVDKIDQVRHEIRFALSQLRPRNGQHEFETMTRTLARATVTRNLLPATGPVASGGDQGRDFETFPTQLPGQVQKIGRRIGVPDRAMAGFACTLQQGDLRPKVREDVNKIMASGTEVDHVVYYCEADVPVAHRHALVDWARDEHELKLIVFDGAAIAEHLADNATYWIAETYLHLPARILPAPVDRPDWYEEDLARWHADTDPIDTMGRLLDLAGCLHYAAYYREGRADIPFWLDRLEGVLEAGRPQMLRRRALYELIVAHARGLTDLTPVDDRVSEYFEDALTATDGQHLSDATLVLMYVIAIVGRDKSSHTADTLRSWNCGLQQRAGELLELDPQPGATCVLLDALAWLRLQPNVVAAEEQGTGYALSDDVNDMSAHERMEAYEAGELIRVNVPLVDVPGSLEAFHHLTQVMDDAPLFPVETIARILNLHALAMVDLPHYDEVVAAVDARLKTTNGEAAAANTALVRAQTLAGGGRLVPALKYLHRARNGLFSGEVHYELVEATLATSLAFRDLSLYMASKQYALAASYLVSRASPAQHSLGLAYAAYADYHQGAWCSAAHLNVDALLSHRVLAEQPMDFNEHGWLSGAFFELTQIRALARSAGEPYESHIEALIADGGLNHVVDGLLASALEGEAAWFDGIDPEEHANLAVESLGRPPFEDTTAIRHIRFDCLGTTWSVRFRNQYADVAVGERFAAALQIVLANLADRDLGLLPMQRTIYVTALPADADLDAHDMDSSPHDARLSVSLPTVSEVTPDSASAVARDTSAAVSAAIVGVSTLPEEELKKLIVAGLEDNLLTNLAFGVPYDTLWRSVVSEEDFDARPHACEPLTEKTATTKAPHREISSPTAPGPGYTREKSAEEIQYRYDDLPPRMRPTLAALAADADFGEVVAELRAEGWKDWQLLIAVHNVAKSARHQFTVPPSQAERKALVARFMEPEPEGDPIAVSLFTAQALRASRLAFVVSSAQNSWGLYIRPEPLPAHAVLDLMFDRYGWREDDVDHADPFAPTSPETE